MASFLKWTLITLIVLGFFTSYGFGDKHGIIYLIVITIIYVIFDWKNIKSFLNNLK